MPSRSRHGETVDPQRELLALGAANLGAGLLQGFPVSSSGSRTAIGDAVGRPHPARRAGHGRLHGARAAHPAARCWRRSRSPRSPRSSCTPPPGWSTYPSWSGSPGSARSELVLALATTAAVLVLGVLLGIVVAIALSVLDLLRRVARPHDAVRGDRARPRRACTTSTTTRRPQVIPGLMVYRYDSPLFFANAENFRTRALAAVDDAAAPVRWFVLNVEAIVEVDITGADALEALRAELEHRGIVFALARIKEDLRDQLARTGLLDRIGEDHIFPTLPTALEGFHEWERTHPR